MDDAASLAPIDAGPVKIKEKLLVVDDDELILESLISIFDSEGYSSAFARTGGDALTLLEREPFNVVIVDVKLTDMTGLELLGKIKDTTPRMRKIVLTGFPDAPSAIEAVNKKVDAYLTKPFDPDSLLKLVAQNLEEQREELRYTQERVLDYIKTRVKQLDETRSMIH
jgi:DNA-binding NtrC family response regulator